MVSEKIGDRSFLLNLAVLLKKNVFLNKSMILFLCPLRCFPILSLKMSSMFKLLVLNMSFL